MAVTLAERRMVLDKYLRGVVQARCGEENVYYQPPANLQMKYPCILYARTKAQNWNANNKVYRQVMNYTITVIDTKPDSEMAAAVSMLPTCTHDRNFIADNLYHDVFTLWK